MTTNIGTRGQVVIPKAIRSSRKIEPGDDFEVLTDEDDFDLILLRRIRPDTGLVKHLKSCPSKGKLLALTRHPEPMRKLKV